MKTSFCLKHDIETHPWAWSKELVAAVEDYKNGEINSKRKLRKFAKREISEYYYNELIERYAVIHRFNKEKKEKERSQKIKDVLCSVVSVVFLFTSVLYVAGDLVIQYGKGVAACYLLLGLWAIYYAAQK